MAKEFSVKFTITERKTVMADNYRSAIKIFLDNMCPKGAYNFEVDSEDEDIPEFIGQDEDTDEPIFEGDEYFEDPESGIMLKGKSSDYVNKKVKTKPAKKVTPKISFEDRKKTFRDSLIPFKEKYGVDLLKEFFEYWTEMKVGKEKMRFEDQDYFDVGRRLGTFKKNQSNFSKGQNNQEPPKSRIHQA